jgi:hypothetical protein
LVVPEIILICTVEVSATLIHLMERMTSGGFSSLPQPKAARTKTSKQRVKAKNLLLPEIE